MLHPVTNFPRDLPYFIENKETVVAVHIPVSPTFFPIFPDYYKNYNEYRNMTPAHCTDQIENAFKKHLKSE